MKKIGIVALGLLALLFLLGTGIVSIPGLSSTQTQASTLTKVETFFGNRLVFDGEFYLLDVYGGDIHDPAKACNPTATAIIPKDCLLKKHLIGWCLTLPELPGKWKVSIKDHCRIETELRSGQALNPNTVYVINKVESFQVGEATE